MSYRFKKKLKTKNALFHCCPQGTDTVITGAVLGFLKIKNLKLIYFGKKNGQVAEIINDVLQANSGLSINHAILKAQSKLLNEDFDDNAKIKNRY